MDYDKLYNLDEKKHQKNNLKLAWQESLIWGDKIPYGIFYENKRKSYEDYLPQLQGKALVKRKLKVRNINKLLEEFNLIKN